MIAKDIGLHSTWDMKTSMIISQEKIILMDLILQLLP